MTDGRRWNTISLKCLNKQIYAAIFLVRILILKRNASTTMLLPAFPSQTQANQISFCPLSLSLHSSGRVREMR